MGKFTTVVQGLVVQGDMIIPWTDGVRSFVELHGLSGDETIALENAEILIHRENSILRIHLRIAIVSKGNLYAFEDEQHSGHVDLTPLGFE